VAVPPGDVQVTTELPAPFAAEKSKGDAGAAPAGGPAAGTSPKNVILAESRSHQFIPDNLFGLPIPSVSK
jgi:hypothetical protein